MKKTGLTGIKNRTLTLLLAVCMIIPAGWSMAPLNCKAAEAKTLSLTEAKKLADIRLKNLLGLIDSVKKLDPDSKNLFKETARLVLKTVKENR